MRIRSIKPEFWRSDDITALSWDARLIFIGLWSYVDDNGVGIDDERRVVADLFAFEEDLGSIRARVTRALDELSRGLLVDRYTVEGRSYLYITGWKAHQKIDRPSKARYPLPPETLINTGARDTLATPSRDTIEPSMSEQGNRGTGEVGTGDQGAEEQVALRADCKPAREDRAPTAQTIVAEWIEHCAKRPPGAVIGQMSKLVKQLLDENIDPDDVRRGVAAWMGKGLHPSTLPSVVNEVMNTTATVPKARDKFAEGIALAERMLRQQDHQTSAPRQIGA